MRLRAVLGTTLIAGAALAACAPNPGGSAGPTSGGTSATQSLPAGTPNVANPIDVAKFRTAPCTVLTAAQLQQLNVGASGKADSDANSPGCTWSDLQGPSKMAPGVTFGPAGHGLADVFSQKATYQYFQQLPDIAGYPAVIALSADSRSQGNCDITIGVSNQQFIDVGVTVDTSASDATAPCGRNQTVAADMIATLKG